MSSDGFRYISQREELVEDIETHRKEARRIAREAYTTLSPGPERDELEKALSELDAIDGIILKERAALTADRIRIKYGVLGRPSNVKIGEAYMNALYEGPTKCIGVMAPLRRDLKVSYSWVVGRGMGLLSICATLSASRNNDRDVFPVSCRYTSASWKRR
jgi:hypothetical protein